MIILIACADKNLLIGADGKIPWYNKEDLAFFKQTTLNSSILMGEKTYRSIGRVLPDRINYVASYQKLEIPGASVVNDAVEFIKNFDRESTLFVIGGASIYQQALEFADKIILSRVSGDYTGDTYFPEFAHKFKLVNIEFKKTFSVEEYQRV